MDSDQQAARQDDREVNRHRVYLALGSNIGDRRGNLREALQRLRAVVELHKISAIYETEPVGYVEQPRFFNLVCAGTTLLPADELLRAAKEIEWQMGRRPTFRNAPRPLDIDILFYDDIRLESEHLTIPHPRLRERAFVLVPLAEISPDLVDPISGKTVRDLLNGVTQEGIGKVDETLGPLLE